VPGTVTSKQALRAWARPVSPETAEPIPAHATSRASTCADCASSVDAPALVVGERWWCNPCLIAYRDAFEQAPVMTRSMVMGADR